MISSTANIWILFWFKKLQICLDTISSSIFERNWGLDIGLQLARTSESRLGFSTDGLITDALKDFGTCPAMSESFIQ